MSQKEIQGPVLKMTVPFSQLANADVFARAHRLRCILYGANTWYAYGELGDWPQEYPEYLQGSGIILEEAEADVLKHEGDPKGWPIGLY